MVQIGRLRFLRLLVVLVLLGIAGRLTWVQLVKAEEISLKAEAARIMRRETQPVRGAIKDRNLMPLALTNTFYLVVADQFQIDDEQESEVASKLAPLLGLPVEAIAKTLRDNPEDGYIELKGMLTLEQKRQIEALQLPGVAMVEQFIRSYPNKSVANQIIGYMAENQGAEGLEGQYEKELAGQAGYVVAEFTADLIPFDNTIRDQKESIPGHDLILSIDLPLQRLVEEKLDQVVKEQDAKRAGVLVMDVHTGEILVMAMRPGADPGDRKTWGDPVNWGLLKPWVLEPMPLGSVFKTITTSAALEEQAITLGTTFIDRGELRLPGCRISNWDNVLPPNPVPMTIDQLMQRSSNVGLVQVGQKISKENFIKYLKGFGFLEPTGIDLANEGGPNLGSDWADKRDCDWAGMYIGQHAEYTPLQLATAVSAIANGGKLVQPHLVREMREPKDGTVVWTAPVKEKRQVISPETAKEVRDVMVSVIRDGTARVAAPKGYTAGGKTGTAQKYENGREKERYVADFVGFAPANNPRVVMFVVVDEPKGQGFGGIVAAPIFGELMPHVMRSLGIAPDTDAAKGQETAPPAATQGVVPDLLWLPTPWAEARLIEAGFVPRVKGEGTLVATQSKQPGSTAKSGDIVELTLVKGNPADQIVHVPDFTGLSLAEAQRLATEVGLTLKTGGSGFVAEQEPKKGTTVPARSTLTLRLAPRR